MKKKKRTQSEINFWQSNTDLMTGLTLVLMLIIMLLILYLIQIPEDSLPDAETGDSYNVDSEIGDTTEDAYRYPEADDEGSGEGDEEREEDYDNDADGGGGGDGDGGDEEETEFNEEFPYPTSSGDEWGKAAVYATVVDAETGRAIRKGGITFELYEEQSPGDGGSLRFLNTYYPVKTEYRNYSTTDEGVFYLPEKIEEGYYYFKQITELEGYDPAESVNFTVDDTYDWDEPYVVSVEVSPSKNIIPVSLVDGETGDPIGEGTFAVTAAENISTADGTVRYTQNQQADTITVDEEGYGESQELYLGTYTVMQDTIPQYYAGINYSTDVEVQKKDGNTPETLTFTCEKTKIKLQLSDELYTNQKLEGAEFTLTCASDPELTQTAETDENGEIVFTDLEKNTTYVLSQNSAPDEYRFDDSETEIFVAEDGRIDGESEVSYTFTNYIPRVEINVQDTLFGNPVSNISMALYDSTDQVIQNWTSSGSAKMFENLAEGSYYVVVNGNESRKYEFEFKEEESMQKFSVTLWTMQNTIAVAVGIGIVILVIVAMIMIWRRRKTASKSE